MCLQNPDFSLRADRLLLFNPNSSVLLGLHFSAEVLRDLDRRLEDRFLVRRLDGMHLSSLAYQLSVGAP